MKTIAKYLLKKEKNMLEFIYNELKISKDLGFSNIINIDFTALNIPVQIKNLLELNPKDTGLSADLCLWGYREPLYIKKLHDFIQKNKFDTVIDIGGNIGYFPLIELNAGVKRIVAVEPIPETYKYLEINTKNFKGVNLENMAISDKIGNFKMYVPDQHNYATSNLENIKILGSDKYNVVKTVSNTLHSLVNVYNLNNESVLIRMDIEGHEVEVLKNIPDCVKGVTFELHPQFLGVDKTVDLLRSLKQVGFKIEATHYGNILLMFLVKKVGLEKALFLIEKVLGKKQSFSYNDLYNYYLPDLIEQTKVTHVLMVR